MSTYAKYPKTFHVPTSPNLQNDDRRIDSMDVFDGKRVIVTLKVDGENCSMYKNYIHARSISSPDHLSRHFVKALHAGIKYDIPENWRICGENCYALHSIFYNKLPSYFLAFGLYDEDNVCVGWDDMSIIFQIIGIETVPVIYDGIYDEKKIQEAYDKSFVLGGWTPKDDMADFCNFRNLIDDGYNVEEFADPVEEGYVIRLANGFHYNDHHQSTAKWVRKGHVQTSEFWLNEKVIPNRLKG